MFDFKDDLEFANAYEKLIADYYGATMSQDKKWDIELDGKTIEIKVDRYFNSTNFFIEMESDTKSGKLGGPYRSEQDGVDEFWYVFVQDMNAVVYKWKTEDLISQLSGVRGWEKLIKNKGWTTRGKLVRKKLLNCTPEEIVLN